MTPAIQKLQAAIAREQTRMRCHRVHAWAPADWRLNGEISDKFLAVILIVSLMIMAYAQVGGLDLFIAPDSLASIGEKLFSRLVVGGIGAVGVFFSLIVVGYATGAPLWWCIGRGWGVAINEEQAQDITAYCQNEPWAAQIVAGWLAATPHQLLGTREHRILMQGQQTISQCRAKIREHQAVASILRVILS